MKRKLITLLALCVVTCASIFGLTACQEQHTHIYNKKVVSETFCLSSATCTQKAKYYFSCECGDIGSAIFEDGDYANHRFENYVYNNDAKCGVNGTETAACEQNGCNKTDTREIVGSALEHSFTNYVFDNNADCGKDGTETAICDRENCNEEHTRTKVGTALEHEWSAWSSNGNNTHTRTCLHNSAHTETKDCNGGTATCTEKAICVDCKESHGGFEKHNYIEQNTDSKYLKKEKECGAKAQYYYSCVCGATGTNFFEHGTELGHAWGAWCSNGNNTHTRTCLNDSTHKETKDCNGGTATCTEKAICVDCKESHGGFEKHNYIEQNTDSKYLKKEKECGAKAQYYYSCVCGATGTNFFEHGTELGHAWGAWCSNGNNTHTRTCLNDSTHKETKDCNGGTATCTQKAICVDCKEDYGELLPPPLEYSVNSGNKSCTITSIGTYTDAEVYIPEKLFGYTVTEIAEKAFENQTQITKLVLPNTLNTIGTRAFFGCTGLTEITIPQSVTSIGTQIFYKSGVETVYYNSSYVSLDNPFLNVKNVIFGGTRVPSYALYNCTIVQNVTISDSVTSIGEYAFEDCSSLTSIEISDSVTSIDSRAFYNCGAEIKWGENPTIETIWDSFWGYKGTSIVIPDSVTSIGWYAFYYCNSLTSIKIPDSVTSIGRYAFSGCDSLTSVTIPDSVTSIGHYAFQHCSSLTKVNYTGTINQWVEIGFDSHYSNPLYYAKNLYINNEIVTKVNLTTATKINDYAFAFCDSLTSVTIPDSVTSIGSAAFSACSSLTSIIIPDSVTSIGTHAFFVCSSLTSITIPDSVTSISDHAFAYCDSLTSITIPDSVTSIGEFAFSNCTSLETIYCRAESKPSGWDSDWKGYGCNAQVVWGYDGE